MLSAQDQSLHHKHGVELNSSVLALCAAQEKAEKGQMRLFKRHHSSSFNEYFRNVNKIASLHFAIEAILTLHDQVVPFY